MNGRTKKNMDEEKAYRGSRKHILDWVESPQFIAELTEMMKPVAVVVTPSATYLPEGYASPWEARLDTADVGLAFVQGVREQLRDWWLEHHKGANTPNWDLVVECGIEGRPGLVLVEAKANWPELKVEGKTSKAGDSPNSRANHDRIRDAIAEARAGLEVVAPGIDIRIDSHYQLANRVAFMWKLATLGIPTVLIYLGFTGDDGIRDAGLPFLDDADWCRAFGDYTKNRIPASMLERRLEFGAAPAWLLVRSRAVLEQSPARAGCRVE
jgi:hypothetical protein